MRLIRSVNTMESNPRSMLRHSIRWTQLLSLLPLVRLRFPKTLTSTYAHYLSLEFRANSEKSPNFPASQNYLRVSDTVIHWLLSRLIT
jgi:hypothetical protein